MKTNFVATITMVSSFTISTTAYSATVFKDGKEWMQVTDSLNISYNTMASYCSTTTGVCTSGTLGSNNLVDGWVWASNVNIANLFDNYIGSEVVLSSGNSAFIPFRKRQEDSDFANSFFSDFSPTVTNVTNTSRGVFGLTRTILVDSFLNSASSFGAVENADHPLIFDSMTIAGLNPDLDFQGDTIGAWVYRDVSPVPVPAAAFMFAPALIGLLGYRRRLRT